MSHSTSFLRLICLLYVHGVDWIIFLLKKFVHDKWCPPSSLRTVTSFCNSVSWSSVSWDWVGEGFYFGKRDVPWPLHSIARVLQHGVIVGEGQASREEGSGSNRQAGRVMMCHRLAVLSYGLCAYLQTGLSLLLIRCNLSFWGSVAATCMIYIVRIYTCIHYDPSCLTWHASAYCDGLI